MFSYLFYEEIDLGMLPSAYTRPVETGRPHLPIIQELWGKGKKKEGPPLTPSLSPMGRGPAPDLIRGKG